ncbi:MAG: DNA photolyase [Desulfosarcinaceae bacterium]|nr:DNA photolyase [Desulfosarcinaceae bacterium]
MPIKTLFIDRAVAHLPAAASIQNRLGIPPRLVDGSEAVYACISRSSDPIQRGKEVLFLTRNKGTFLRECPGTRDYTCCGYKILHIGTYCTMDCAYCILQAYFHPPVLQLFLNHAAMQRELAAIFGRNEISRIGTGEFTDSLIWETWISLSKRLVPLFARQRRAILELKTKSTAIGHLAKLDHNRKTIIAWSLNTPQMIADAERGTASLDARLRAAVQCQKWGYPLAFHLDPMVIYDGCEVAYEALVDRLFTHVDSRNIAWISLGSFRFMPALKSIVQQRFPATKIIYGEFIPGLDGKMRYFQPLRTALYRRVAARIKAHAPDLMVYFCMEDAVVWEKALGMVPEGDAGLSRLLDAAARRVCDLSLD